MALYQVFFGVAVALIMISKSQAVEYAPYPQYEEPVAYPKYSFEYEVKDEHTKDIKSQKESRDGHSVTGSYSLLQPDGKTRTVAYVADEKAGFNAVVNYEGGSYEYAAPKYEPLVKYEAPEIKYEAAPVIQYEAPIKYETPTKYESPKYKSFASASVKTPDYSYKY